jgi:hypothetical protein
MSTNEKTAEQLQHQLDQIIDLVASNHYASAFQSLGQYRVALHEFIKEVTK